MFLINRGFLFFATKCYLKYLEQVHIRKNSWTFFYLTFRYQNCFHGVDLCQLREQALNEYLRQPIVDTFDIGTCLAKSIRHSLDFLTAQEKDLHHLGKWRSILNGVSCSRIKARYEKRSYMNVDSDSIQEYSRDWCFLWESFFVILLVLLLSSYTLVRESCLNQIIPFPVIPLEFHILKSCTMHGLAFWFDVAFLGSTQTVWLSTAPTEPLTHWYQVNPSGPVFANAVGKVFWVGESRASPSLSYS